MYHCTKDIKTDGRIVGLLTQPDGAFLALLLGKNSLAVSSS
jgi:hypothetical protein